MSFKKGIKREITAYPSLKNERYFDGFKRSLFIVAKTHEYSEALDPNYTPGCEPEEKELFEAKQTFMFSVFNTNLQTDMGKTIVGRHLASTDAQAVWKELSEHMRTSSKEASEKRRLTQYVTNTDLDDNFKGTTEQFVLHFNEYFRQLEEISEDDERLPPTVKLTLLQTAVRSINDLRIVETLDEFQSTTHGHGSSTSLSYDTYYDLLIKACVWYDKTKKANIGKRRNFTPDISIILLFTFYQPVFYATYDQHFPSESEERAGYSVGFGEHCGDAMTHKILDHDTQKIIYRSAVRPKKSSTPNHRLAPHGGEVSASSDPSVDKISSGSPLGSPEGSSPDKKAPTVFIRSRDEENPSGSKPMPTFDPSDLIRRTFLLPPEENGERHRAKVTRQVVEIIDQDNGQRVEKINFILDIGNGKVEELISYNQLLEHLENAQDHDMGMDQELYRFRAIIGHQGPLLASDPDWKGSKYNVQVEWETGEITFEPLSIIAADDPVTCAAYAKENDLLALEGWRRFRSLAKKDKVLTRAIKQSKIRQVRKSQRYMFGYLIPRNYMEAMQFDSENKNSKWYDAIKLEMESMSKYKVFKKWDNSILDKHNKVKNLLKVIIGLKFI